jgi:antitoxin component YwqK of YwqJK toxin-antitoxin module
VRIKYILFLFLFILIGCSSPPDDGPHKEYYDNGQVSEEGTIKDGLWNGPHKSYHSNGQLSEEGTLKGGLWHGPYKSHHSNGQLFEEGSFNNSQWDGPYKSYHSNGQLSEEGTLYFVGSEEDSVWDGPYKSFTENGIPILKGTYKNSKFSGFYSEYYDNGQLNIEGKSKDGLWNGPYKFYSENGILEEVGIYKNGDVIEFTPIEDFSGTWRYKGTYDNATLVIDGDTYTLRGVLMGTTVDNDEGVLEIFTTTTTNEFNDEIIIQGIRLLNSSRKPKFWLDPNRGTLSVPWRYIGSSRYVNQSYYSEYLFYKE